MLIACLCITWSGGYLIWLFLNMTRENRQDQWICSGKNLYSNPLKGQEHLCVFTALSCYISLYSEQLEGMEKIFIHPDSQYCTTAHGFELQIGEIAKRYFEIFQNYVRLSHFNIHGIWKGSGTHAASTTTCPPLFLLQLHVEVSGAWGRSWIFTSNLLPGEIIIWASSWVWKIPTLLSLHHHVHTGGIQMHL